MSVSANQATAQRSALGELIARLQNVKFGDDVQDPRRFKMKNPILANLIQNLVMSSRQHKIFLCRASFQNYLKRNVLWMIV